MRSFLRIISIILLIVWMGLIFLLSNQTREVSSQTSGGVIEFIAEKVYPDFENLTEIEKEEVVESFQFVARKSAHIGIFAVLGFLAFLSFISYTNLRFFTRIFWACAVSVLYAASDEYHQYYIEGRGCELRDFLLDIVGIFGAVLICALFVTVISPLRRKTAWVGLGNDNNVRFDNISSKPELNLNYSVANSEFSENEIEEYKEEMQEPKEESINHDFVENNVSETVDIPITEDTEITKMEEIELSDEMKYASSVIGEVVIEVAKLCDKITEQQGESSKELVNLALGRTEVLKSEILKILYKDITFEEKKNLIENEKRNTYDYFDSILAQNC